MPTKTKLEEAYALIADAEREALIQGAEALKSLRNKLVDGLAPIIDKLPTNSGPASRAAEQLNQYRGQIASWRDYLQHAETQLTAMAAAYTPVPDTEEAT